MGKDSGGYSNNKADVKGQDLESLKSKINTLQNKVLQQQLQISNDAIDRLNDDRDIEITMLKTINETLNLEMYQAVSVIESLLPFLHKDLPEVKRAQKFINKRNGVDNE